MTSILTTAYSASNYSTALQVLDESVNFVVTFSFKGVAALVSTFGSAALDVQSRPPSLPLLLTVNLPGFCEGKKNSIFNDPKVFTPII